MSVDDHRRHQRSPKFLFTVAWEPCDSRWPKARLCSLQFQAEGLPGGVSHGDLHEYHQGSSGSSCRLGSRDHQCRRSPTRFDRLSGDATYDRSAAAFDNSDHVAVVIHNYRWRLGLAEGEPKYDDLEKRLAQAPVITVPTITLEGDANGAPYSDPASYAKKFSGKYEHRTIMGGIGHNLPQEAPQAFAQAVVDVAKT